MEIRLWVLAFNLPKNNRITVTSDVSVASLRLFQGIWPDNDTCYVVFYTVFMLFCGCPSMKFFVSLLRLVV